MRQVGRNLIAVAWICFGLGVFLIPARPVLALLVAVTALTGYPVWLIGAVRQRRRRKTAVSQVSPEP